MARKWGVNMLVAGIKGSRISINAWQASRGDGPFCCPACGKEVVLHKGQIRVHHFAHKADSVCRHGTGETDLHRRAKMELYQALSAHSELECRLEVPLDGVRADVWLRSVRTKRTYAIEVQISQLTMAQIIERTKRYAKQGVYVLWVFEWKQELLTAQYSPSLKERWAHALNFGYVYYWRGDDEVTPVKFGKHLLYRPASTWFEQGEEQSAGGYEYASKRYRTPIVGKSLHISRDFQGVQRAAWKGGDIEIPACRILTARSL
jgi:competence protein CoiA